MVDRAADRCGPAHEVPAGALCRLCAVSLVTRLLVRDAVLPEEPAPDPRDNLPIWMTQEWSS